MTDYNLMSIWNMSAPKNATLHPDTPVSLFRSMPLVPPKHVSWRIVAGMGLVLLLFFWEGPKARAAFEIETDPIAFALDGYSLHLILSGASSRIDLGVFGLTLPDDSSNPDYTVSFEGVGLKWDYHGDRIDGAFWGVEYADSTVTFKYDKVGDGKPEESTTRKVIQRGVRIGYRIGTEGFYVTPWVGVSKSRLPEEVVLGGQRYDHSETFVFPTVHIGYRF